MNAAKPANKDFDRILKSLIVVDAISLIDNLYPNPTVNPAHQEKSFLDLGQWVKLKGIKILEGAHANLDTSLVQTVRQVRNKISAHIEMYLLDHHNPPHFHAEYAEFTAEYEIQSMKIVAGKLPNRAHALVLEWVSLHREELFENWQRAREHKQLKKIKPLD